MVSYSKNRKENERGYESSFTSLLTIVSKSAQKEKVVYQSAHGKKCRNTTPFKMDINKSVKDPLSGKHFF